MKLLFVFIATIVAISLPLPIGIPKSISGLLTTQNRLPFPKWLSDFTGLKDWPNENPPYIPLDFIDFSKIENNVHHTQGQCASVESTGCSFDCANCVSFDDIYTCPVLSQTFDDGPTPATVKLLDNLKTRSTFFVLGLNVVKHPEIYKKAVEKNHVMGSHSWSHKFLPSLTNEEIIAQIEWSIWAMNATAGHLPKWFRPPYGGLDNRVRSITRQFGMQNVLWNIDTSDWKLNDNSRTETEILSQVQGLISQNSQGIMLEHDMMIRTVNVAIEVNKKLPNQLTVPECVGGIDYIKKFY